jgi:hypothetical protein
LDVNAEPAAEAVVKEASHENLMDVSANVNTLLAEDIFFPEENSHENLMYGSANGNPLHTDDISPATECVTGGQPTIQFNGPPLSSDEAAQESDSDLENENKSRN